MKMGNITSRAGIEATSLAFLASVLTIIPPTPLADVNIHPTPTCLCVSLLERSVQTITLFGLELEVFQVVLVVLRPSNI